MTPTSTAFSELNPDPEVWLNVSRPGNWNTLHGHPGATFSGVYYASGSFNDSLAGRLIMAVGAPEQLSEHSLPQVHQGSAGRQPTGRLDLQLLKVDPEPGVLVVFPSFIPHFVMPFEATDMRNTDPRISLAFNYATG